MSSCAHPVPADACRSGSSGYPARGRGAGRRDPALRSPRSLRVPARWQGRGARRKGRRILLSPKPLLVCVFLKRCMLTHTPLFIPPSASSSFFSLLFSRSPRAVAFVSGFRIPPWFLSTCNLVTPVLRNSPPLPEGQRNKNRHKMSCERSSWKVFLQKIRGTNEGLPLGTRTFSHLQSILKPKKTDH